MSEPIRVFLVDHHTLLRRCLAVMLNRRRGFEVVGDAASGNEALSLAGACRPDVVVVEPESPEGGVDLIARLCEEFPASAVIVLSHCYDDAAKNSLLAGARGCIDKTCEPQDLVRAIQRVHAGEIVMAPEMIDTILESLNGNEAPSPVHNGLTERELEVLQLVVAGLTNPEIARKLYITDHTVKGHLAKILGKLGLDNRVQLATYALQHGLVTDPDAELSRQD